MLASIVVVVVVVPLTQGHADTLKLRQRILSTRITPLLMCFMQGRRQKPGEQPIVQLVRGLAHNTRWQRLRERGAWIICDLSINTGKPRSAFLAIRAAKLSQLLIVGLGLLENIVEPVVWRAE